MLFSDQYEFINKRCDDLSGVKDIDWGYYSTKDGDCSKCMYLCSKDQDCETVECGGNYCKWWKNGKCDDEKELTLLSNGTVLTWQKYQNGKLMGQKL